MSTSLDRRSPSLESMSSMSSAFSFDDNPGITTICPNIPVQSAPQGGVTSNFWTQAEQEDWLPESERMGRTAPLRDAHSKVIEAPQAPVKAYPMHERFCFPADNIYFLVQGVLYSVHRYFFERDSSSFVGQGVSKQEPMVLASVSTHDFDLFLSILYPTTFGTYPASTVEEWSGILYLADRWGFLSIRALSIAQIAPIASPIDKIVFGRLYDINDWLTGAYHAVCARLDALSLEEGRRLGVDDVVRINSIRQDFCFIRVSESSPKLLEEDVKSRFNLAIQTEQEHSASRESVQDVADMSKPDTAAEATSKKEEAARTAEIGRMRKREREAAAKKAKDLENKRAQEKHEADAKVAEIERQKEATDKKAKDLENRRAQEQREEDAEAAEIEQQKRENEAAKAAEIEQQQREQEAADNQVKVMEKRRAKEQRKAEAKLKEKAAKAAEIERNKVEQQQQQRAEKKAEKKAKELEKKKMQENHEAHGKSNEEMDAKIFGTPSPKLPPKTTWGTVSPRPAWGTTPPTPWGASPITSAWGIEVAVEEPTEQDDYWGTDETLGDETLGA